MKLFQAPSVVLQTPDQWQDQSTYVVSGPAAGGFRANVVVAINQRILDPYLTGYVDRQVAELRKTLPNFMLLNRSDTFTMPYGQAAVIEMQWTSAEAGQQLRQYQMYVLAGTVLYTITATAAAHGWPTVQHELLGIVQSFRPQPW